MLQHVKTYTDNESLNFQRGQWQPIDEVNRITKVSITDALRRQEKLWGSSIVKIFHFRVSLTFRHAMIFSVIKIKCDKKKKKIKIEVVLTNSDAL